MRHGKKHNHLKRTSAHRKALLRNLTISLVEHKRIMTTLAKAKALRVFIEPLITKAKDNKTHNRRIVFSYLQDKECVKTLFNEIGPKVADRPGGYVRVIRTGFRKSDSAEMAMIEFVDYNDVYNAKDSGKKSGRRRRRRGGSNTGSGTNQAAAATAELPITAPGEDLTPPAVPSSEEE